MCRRLKTRNYSFALMSTEVPGDISARTRRTMRVCADPWEPWKGGLRGIEVRSTTPRYKTAGLTSRREKRRFKSLGCEQELYRVALRTDQRTAMERNELCSLPGYWHSCRVVNRSWHLPEWNQWLSVRNVGMAAQSIVHSRDFAKFAANRSLRVGRCPLLNHWSRLESRA